MWLWRISCQKTLYTSHMAIINSNTNIRQFHITEDFWGKDDLSPNSVIRKMLKIMGLHTSGRKHRVRFNMSYIQIVHSSLEETISKVDPKVLDRFSSTDQQIGLCLGSLISCDCSMKINRINGRPDNLTASLMQSTLALLCQCQKS